MQKKHDFLRFFELLHTFSRTMVVACRTEFVVEKLLTNWLSLCMHGYLKKHVARALFMLYKAIKHQTEKGPVDAVTCDARYALSEDRLLREQTECRPLVTQLLSIPCSVLSVQKLPVSHGSSLCLMVIISVRSTLHVMNTFIRQRAEKQTEQNIYREVKYTKIHDTISQTTD